MDEEQQAPDEQAEPDWDTIYQEAGEKHGVDPNLLRAIRHAEGTEADPYQVSEKGAAGPFQIIPDTAKRYGVKNRFDAKESADAAAHILKDNFERYGGDADQAVLAYHGGTDKANWGPRTQHYHETVSNAYAQLMQQAGDLANKAPPEKPTPPPKNEEGPAPFSPEWMQQRISVARQAGYSDNDIAQQLEKSPDFAPAIEKARNKGWDDQKIFGHLGLDQFEPQGTVTAMGHGLVRGTIGAVASLGEGLGAGLSGAGEAMKTVASADQEKAQETLALMDRVDAGEAIPEDDSATQLGAKIFGRPSTAPPIQRPVFQNGEFDVGAYQRLSPEERAKVRQEFAAHATAQPPAEQSPLHQAGTAIAGVGQHVAKRWDEIEKDWQAAYPISPENSKKIAVQVAQGAPGFAAYLGAGAVAGIPVVMGLAGAQAYGAMYNEAKAKGLSEGTAQEAGIASGLANGALMGVPVHQILDSVPLAFRQKVLQGLWQTFKNGSSMLGITETMKVVDNVIARETGVDPGRPVTQGLGEGAAASFILGTTPSAAATAARAVRGKPAEAAKEPPSEEPKPPAGEGPEPPPPPAGAEPAPPAAPAAAEARPGPPAATLTPRYDHATGSYGLADGEGKIVKAGYASIADAEEAAAQASPKPAPEPSAGAPITASQVQRRDGVGYAEAARRAEAENAAAGPEAAETQAAPPARRLTPIEELRARADQLEVPHTPETSAEELHEGIEAAEAKEARGPIVPEARAAQPVTAGESEGPPIPPEKPPKRGRKPTELLAFIAANGGIRDDGGDLAAMNAPWWIRRKNGLPPDEMRSRAQQEGYLPPDDPGHPATSSIADLLDAISDSLAGKKVYRRADRSEIDARQAEDSVTAEGRSRLTELGIPHRDTPDHHIGEAVRLAEATREAHLDALDKAHDDAMLAYYAGDLDLPHTSESHGDEIPFEPAAKGPGEAQQRHERQPPEAGLASGAAEIAGRGEERAAVPQEAVERAPAGDQHVIPGTEVTDRDRLKARARQPLRGGEKPLGEGLFDVAGRGQEDLVERARAPEPVPQGGWNVIGQRGNVLWNARTQDEMRDAVRRGFKVEEVNPLARTNGEPKTPANTPGKPSFREPTADTERLAKDTVGHEPKNLYTPAQQRLAEHVAQEAHRLAPTATVQRYQRITHKGQPKWGAFVPHPEELRSLIAWSLESPDAIGTVRHEVIHYLRRTGAISEPEWQALVKRAEADGWAEKHQIDKRYKNLTPERHIEEAIAEEFSLWRRSSRRASWPAPARALFNRLDLLMRRIADWARKIFGKDATAEDIFTRIETGQVGRRGEREPTLDNATAHQAPSREESRAAQAWLDTVGRLKTIREVLDHPATARLFGNDKALVEDLASIAARDTAKPFPEKLLELRDQIYSDIAEHARIPDDTNLVVKVSAAEQETGLNAKQIWGRFNWEHSGKPLQGEDPAGYKAELARIRSVLRSPDAPTPPAGPVEPRSTGSAARGVDRGKPPGDVSFQAPRDQTETPEFKRWFGESKVVDKDGKPLTVYHGAQRPDRIGEAFDRERATSGPMPFFTDNPEIASNYAKGKPDTSLEVDDYSPLWKINGQQGFDKAWQSLPAAKRVWLRENGNRIRENEDTGRYEIAPPGEGYAPHETWARALREAKGNGISALWKIWYEGGHIFGAEGDFAKILKAAGIDRAEYDDPRAVYSAVVPTYLSIRNPLDTAHVPPEVVRVLEAAADRPDAQPKYVRGADQWDKDAQDPHEWVARLKEDLAGEQNSFAWTSIPDWVTRSLREQGYDGIHDTGGKMGGEGHGVWIPFDPTQIKSATGNRGTFDPHDPRIAFQAPPDEERPLRPEQPMTIKEGREHLDAVSDALADHLKSLPPDTYARRLREMAPPDGPNKFKGLNFAERFSIFPRTLASLDSLSADLYNRWKGRTSAQNKILDEYRHEIPTFLKLSESERNRVYGAEEQDRIFNRQRTPDEPVAVENTGSTPYARFTKAGDKYTLTAAEKTAYFERRALFAKAWSNIMEGAARKLGWDGAWTGNPETDINAILDRAKTAQHPSIRHQMQRVADLMVGMEQQRRTAYVPLMRFGNYFIAVKPKAGVDKTSLGGFPETKWFGLVERPSLQDWAGAKHIQGEVPKEARARMDELRQQFPQGEYDIEHGYLFNKPDVLRKIDIPAVEKLLMLMENGVRRDLKERMMQSGEEAPRQAAKEAWDRMYNDLLDTFRDEMYKELKAGFKKRANVVPGYSNDFDRVTGAYMHWTSRHVADLLHGDAIEKSYQRIQDEHPYASTKDYWKRWRDYQDEPSSPLSRAGQSASQLGFMYTLAANPSSSFIIALHGPVVGHASLSAGIGGLKAGAALYGALGQVATRIRADATRGLYIDPASLGRNEAERRLIGQFHEEGLLHSVGADDMRALNDHQATLWGQMKPLMRRGMDIASSNISVIDQMNRAGTALAAYRLASDPKNLAKMDAAWRGNQIFRDMVRHDGLTPETVARFMMSEAALEWGRANTAPIMRGPAGQALFLLHGFQTRALSTMWKLGHNMGPSGKIALGWLGAAVWATAGVEGLPFVQDLENATDKIWELIAKHDPMISYRIRSMLADSGFGKVGAETIMRGPMSQLLGVDLASRVGFGDIITRELSGADYIGTLPSILMGRMKAMYKRHESGQSLPAVLGEALPAGVRNPLRATAETMEGLKTQKGKTVTSADKIPPLDIAKQAAGFRPLTQERQYEASEWAYRAKHAKGPPPRNPIPSP